MGAVTGKLAALSSSDAQTGLGVAKGAGSALAALASISGEDAAAVAAAAPSTNTRCGKGKAVKPANKGESAAGKICRFLACATPGRVGPAETTPSVASAAGTACWAICKAKAETMSAAGASAGPTPGRRCGAVLDNRGWIALVFTA